jgi:hypothetical protein
MSRLAVAIDDDLVLRTDVMAVSLPTRLADQLYRRRQEPVLLYRPVAEIDATFFGVGRLVGLSFPDERATTRAVIALSQGFATPVLRAGVVRLPRERQVLSLADDDFQAIVRNGASSPLAEPVAREDHTPFQGGGDGGLRHLDIYRGVLRDYDFRCAFTGYRSAEASGLDPMLHVEAIWPLASGGPLTRDNFLPMTASVRHGWQSGHLTLAPDLAFVVDRTRIEDELFAALRPDGRLARPASGLTPSQPCLSFHRTHVFLSQSRLRE